jgi:hypothetical protein
MNRRATRLLLLLAATAVAAGCGGSSDDEDTTATDTGAAGSAEVTATPVNVESLPLGDDQYEESGPRKGYVYSCITDFMGGGAFEQGPWIDAGNGTWNLTEKISVEGEVEWDSQFSSDVSGADRTLSGNGLPPQPSGTFPVAASDPAYQYDRNPNSIEGYTLMASIPADPQRADEPSCVGGTIGVAKNGIPIFSAFDAGGRDAVATEVQDDCEAHPEMTGQYHYHGLSSCIADIQETVERKANSSELVGWALDGFGIYVERDSEGTMLSSADLDECHGRTSTVEWDGEQVEMYHYVATLDFPYMVACYRGTPLTEAEGLAIGPPDTGGAAGEGPPGGAGPPDGAPPGGAPPAP